MAGELRAYTFNLVESSAGNGDEKWGTLPKNKKLLVKQIWCVIGNLKAANNVTGVDVEVQILNRKDVALVYNLPNIVQTFKVQTSGLAGATVITAPMPSMPLIWVPPSSYYLYGDVLAAALSTNGTPVPITAMVRVLGILADIDPLTKAQQTVSL